MTDARIYVASLADYNAGRLHGTWIELEEIYDAEDLSERVQAMLAQSKELVAEEYAIHDHEGLPSSLIGEFSSLEEIAKLADLVETYDAESVEAASCFGNDLEEISDVLRDGFGVYESAKGYAYEWIDGMGDLPEHYQSYFDYERFGDELLMDRAHTYEGGNLYVFNRR